jgi:hypothetical protein
MSNQSVGTRAIFKFAMNGASGRRARFDRRAAQFMVVLAVAYWYRSLSRTPICHQGRVFMYCPREPT